MWYSRFVHSALSRELCLYMPGQRHPSPSHDFPSELFTFGDDTILLYCRAHSTTIVTAKCNLITLLSVSLTTTLYSSSCLRFYIAIYKHTRCQFHSSLYSLSQTFHPLWIHLNGRAYSATSLRTYLLGTLPRYSVKSRKTTTFSDSERRRHRSAAKITANQIEAF